MASNHIQRVNDDIRRTLADLLIRYIRYFRGILSGIVEHATA